MRCQWRCLRIIDGVGKLSCLEISEINKVLDGRKMSSN